MVQLFVRGLGPSSRAVSVGLDQSVAQLKQLIQAPECGHLVFQFRQLQDELPLRHYGIAAESNVHFVGGLPGGKGGFGALLRGQGRDGKVTTNYDACRDLSGRRVRHTTIESKLAEWREGAPERELEKVAAQHIKDLARQQRREEMEAVDMEAIAAEHEEVIERSRRAVQEAISGGLAAGSSRANPAGSAAAAAAAAAGAGAGPSSSAAAGAGAGVGAGAGPSSSRGAAAQQQQQGGGGGAGGKRGWEEGGGGSSTSSGGSSETAGGGVAAGGGQQPPKKQVPAKKPKMLAMLEDVSSSDDEDESDV